MATPHISVRFLNIPWTFRELLVMLAGLELFAAKRNSADSVMCVGGGTKGKLRRSTNYYYYLGGGAVQRWGRQKFRILV